MAFRNVTTDATAPVGSWPQEAVLASLERGSLSEWRRLAASIASTPWGPVARSVEEVLSYARPYGVSNAMERVIADARGAAAQRERLVVTSELAGLVARSGVSKAEFARRLGTSASRFSTYLSGAVVPSAALMVRARSLVR